MSAPQRLRVGAPHDPAVETLVSGLDLPPWSARFELVRARPAELVAGLRAGTFDLALVPAPITATGALDVDVVPGLSVCTAGPSGLARLVSRVPLRGVRTVESDAPDHAAEVLCAALFAESGQPIEFVRPGEAVAPDAVLVVGGAPVPETSECIVDLGEAWTSLTGLPMVWWVWGARAGMVSRETYAVLHTARTRGKHAGPAPEGVRFRLGRKQVDGIEALARAAGRLGLAQARREIGLKWVRLSPTRPCGLPNRRST